MGMTKQKVFVSSVGRTGEAIARCLLQKDEFEVYVGLKSNEMTKKESMLSKLAVNTVGINDTEAMKKCLMDVGKMYIIPSSAENRVEIGKKMIDMAMECKVNNVILISVIGTENYFPSFKTLENYLLKSSIECANVVHSAYYMENLLFYLDEIRSGHLTLPVKHESFSMLSVEDLAKFLVTLSPTPHCTYEVTGNLYTTIDICNIINESLGWNVSHRDSNIEHSMKTLVSKNVPKHEIELLNEFYKAVLEKNIQHCTDTFQRVVKENPITLSKFVRTTFK